ncbi:undecaprenyldiphospho-muramoylpentapeptide beta-N-acetylglucosaminyltransferase [Denitratisoma oestradiolicum]|uniref:UDP-N-acetylglucosamine--N-acetylmuramyl-(pentapeptide) pyrophosphoryl-undecaprenol N-acetylglucosamine transferase n=1 Tax=Denitratisoma oestradiolicum TaxID=311182 RepID=A0A6S6XW66_9PROT|nr:undecaprenyldiphospho-muramoylpentapeptide beta-N-acetylglucosaminyltransferase [Denitratisoma oestradiolicum]TWO80427.1 undecaprenyldiphospho-muramoylpentapeptide beta-N-acetylglucosaminyltransferase [Denitratisoma oestradiolicum]CAB1370239.1 N-acetylglucosaminyl transferase [Denitratisoma oestradiolicum]
MKTILVMAGGTGGHIMPGLAVADHLRSLGWRVVWMGNPEGMEARLIPERGFETAWVRFSALRGKGLLRKLLLPLNLLFACFQAWREMRRVQPDVVLGLGGYITFPGGLVAALTGRPLVLHEQNSVAGLANRVLARLAKRVLTGFPGVLRGGEWVGNPVRPEISHLPAPDERLAGREGPLRLLVLGGSLGAQVLNRTLPAGLARISTEERPEVWHQSGEKHIEDLRACYAEAGVEARLAPFIADMAEAYAWADLVVCRAGALTVAELAAAGVASVLVPFPHAVDDHQTANALFLSQAGAAVLLPQEELQPETLSLLRNYSRPQLLEMARRARDMAKPDATVTVARVCMEEARGKRED